MRRALITGGAGFIGSTLADRLLAEGLEVVVYDDFSTGFRENVTALVEAAGATVVEGDVLDQERLASALEECDTVFHLAANADVRHGLAHPTRDLRQNTIATSRVLEAMRAAGVRRIVFSSTGSVYGEPTVFPTPEDCPFPSQTSLYAASKLAAEALLQAYSHGYGFTAAILRFVSVLGERYPHGHVYDFYAALRRDPTHLTVLGDGRQEKSYLYVQDCVEGMLCALAAVPEGEVETFNLGTAETLRVDDSVALITRHLGVTPRIEHTGGKRGWPGDSPRIHLDCSRIRSHGWRPRLSVRESVLRTLAWFDENPYMFERTPQ